MEAIRQNLQQGRREVYDADLSRYFDTIPHDKLMVCVRKRVSDRSVLHLIPSEKSLPRVREKLKKRTDASQCVTPIRPLIERINRRLCGWQGYFSQGYAHQLYRDVGRYTLRRLRTHLTRRSPRGYTKPKGVTWWDHLQRLARISHHGG